MEWQLPNSAASHHWAASAGHRAGHRPQAFLPTGLENAPRGREAGPRVSSYSSPLKSKARPRPSPCWGVRMAAGRTSH